MAFYIWLTDTGADFEYQPECDFWYEYGRKRHRYHPDFRVGGQYYEVKGSHMIAESGEWICPWDASRNGLYEAKRRYVESHGIIVLTADGYRKYLDYVAGKYGKDWLDGFKNEG